MSNDDDDDLAALVASEAPAESSERTVRPRPLPPVEDGPNAETTGVEAAESVHDNPPNDPEPWPELPDTGKTTTTPAPSRQSVALARSRLGPGTARVLPVPGARLLDQWKRREGRIGIHFVAPGDTPVHAIAAGIAVLVDAEGRRLEVRADDGRTYAYGRIEPAPSTRSGERVWAGAMIGNVAAAPAPDEHPRLEVGVQEPDGHWVNPYDVLLGLPDADELTVHEAETAVAVDPDVEAVRAPSARAVPSEQSSATDRVLLARTSEDHDADPLVPSRDIDEDLASLVADRSQHPRDSADPSQP